MWFCSEPCRPVETRALVVFLHLWLFFICLWFRYCCVQNRNVNEALYTLSYGQFEQSLCVSSSPIHCWFKWFLLACLVLFCWLICEDYAFVFLLNGDSWTCRRRTWGMISRCLQNQQPMMGIWPDSCSNTVLCLLTSSSFKSNLTNLR